MHMAARAWQAVPWGFLALYFLILCGSVRGRVIQSMALLDLQTGRKRRLSGANYIMLGKLLRDAKATDFWLSAVEARFYAIALFLLNPTLGILSQPSWQ